MLKRSFAYKPLSWQRSQYSPSIRQMEIFMVAAEFLFFLCCDRILSRNSSAQKHRRGKWLVRKMLELGPTFIKIGQALSTRSDLIPLEYVEEFSELQDRVPSFSGDKAIAIIEGELGKSIYSLFKDFDPSPLASASLGQVHRVKLYTGEEIVIKVQRQGLGQLFNLDFQVLHRLMALVNILLPWIRKYNLESIYQEFFELLFQEIDYINEGKNAERFRTNFKKYRRVLVPKVYWEYTTQKILALEYLPGIKINDRQGLINKNINTDEIIKLGICCYLKQLLEDGFFQSDPHPGNMAVSEKGEIIFYDFGTMAEVKSINQEHMVKTFFAVLRKDTDGVVEMLIYMGLLEPVSDMTPVKRLVSFLLDKFRDKPIDFNAFGEIKGEMYLMFEQQPFRFPPQMTFILKSLTTLDGIARSLNPQYNLLAASQPFIKNIIFSNKKGNIVKNIFQQTSSLLKTQIEKPSKTEILIKSLEQRIEQGELQVRVRSVENERILKLIHLAIKCLVYACLTGCSLLSGIMLLSTVYSSWAAIAFSVTGLWLMMLLRSLIKMGIKERLYKQKG